jgi:hypothetical protein
MDEIKQLEERLKQLKLEKRLKELKESGGEEVYTQAYSIKYDANKFRLEKIKENWVLVEIVEEVDPEKETEFSTEDIRKLKKEKN